MGCAFPHSRRPRITGRQLAKVIGHYVSAVHIFRSLLSMPRASYVFIVQCWNKRCRLWPSVSLEMAWISHLVGSSSFNLALPWSETLTVSDACLSGYAVAQARVGKYVVESLGITLERWRYNSNNTRRPSS